MKNKNKSKNKKEISVPAISVIDNIVFSDKEVWAYYKIGSVPYDFLTDEGKVSLSSNLMIAFSSISGNSSKGTDLQLLVTNTPTDVDSWEKQMIKAYDEWNVGKYRLDTFEKFMRKQTRALKRQGYKKKVSYLGVKLFTRGTFSFDGFNMLDFGFAEAYELIKKSISSILMVPDENISGTEKKRAKSEEKEIYRAIRSGSLKATKVSSEELLLVMKKALYPGMPTPYLEVDHNKRIGLNDIVMETGAIIEDHRRYLAIKQMVHGIERTGYRATLSFSKFPSSKMNEPYGIDPFMYLPTVIGLPFTMSARVTLMPADAMKKNLKKKKLENDDELKNLQQSGQQPSISLLERQEDINALDNQLNQDNMPWVSGSYRMTVETNTYELLITAIQEMKQEYAKDDVGLTWTTGDQLELLMEEMPGGSLQVNDFTQMTNLAMLGVSGFNYGGSVGDPIFEKVVNSKKGER